MSFSVKCVRARSVRARSAAAGGVVDPPTIAPGAPLGTANDSPTGRNPRLMWSAAQQTVWERWKSDHDANPSNPATIGGKWYKQAKTKAETTPRSPNTDMGFFNAWMYQVTGDTQYVTGAVACFDAWLYTLPTPPGWSGWDSNIIRNHWGNFVIAMEYLWPGLGSSQRATLYTTLVQNLEKHVDFYGAESGWPLGDSDQVLGVYFHVMTLAALFPEESRIQTLATQAKVGGLVATASNRTSTARNAIKYYHETLAAGGSWIESSHYNIETPVHALTGATALRNFHGVNYFPEIADYWPRLARFVIAQFTPDLSLHHKWGDEQEPTTLLTYVYSALVAMLSGVLRGTTTGNQINQLIADLGAKHGFASGAGALTPLLHVCQALYWFDDTDTAASYETDANRAYYSSGPGIQAARSGWADTDTLFCNHSGRRVTDAQFGTWWPDHLLHFHGSLWAWRNGGYLLRGPMGYNGCSVWGEGANVALVHGMGDCYEYKDVVCQHGATTHAFLQTATAGSFLDASHGTGFPDNAVHEMTRAVLYVPKSTSGGTDVVIVQDRVYVDAIAGANLALYPGGSSPDPQGSRAGDFIARAHARAVVIWHMPVSPTVSSPTVTWDTEPGQKAKLTVLSPSSPTLVTIDELADFQVPAGTSRFGWDETNVYDFECNYQVQVRSNATWTPFLTVFAAHGTVTPATATLVEDAGKAHGAHVVRTGENDVVAVFNSAQASAISLTAYHASNQTSIPRQHYHAVKTFSITWTASASTTELYLADLDPALKWTLNLDSGGAVEITPTEGGFFRRTVSGTGSHTIAVAGTNDLAGAADTTAQAGNWWTPSTWTSGVVPNPLDTVTLNHAVTTDWNVTTAGVTQSAAWTLNADRTLILKGNVTQGNATFTAQGGSRIRFDTTAADRKWLTGTAANQSNAKVVLDGTADAPVYVDKVGSNECWFDAGDEGGGGFANSSGWTIIYTRMTSIGKDDGSLAIRSNNQGNNSMTILGSVFDGCATVFKRSTGQWSAASNNNYSVRDSTWKNSTSGSINLDAYSDGNTGSGTKEVVGCVFDKGINLGLKGMVVADNYFDVMPVQNGTTHTTWERNVVRFSSNTQTLFMEGATDYTYLLADHVTVGQIGNPHFNQNFGTYTHLHVVCEYPHTTTDGGDAFFGSGMTTAAFRYVLCIPSATDGVCSSNVFNPVEPGSNNVVIEHCTLYGKIAQAIVVEYDVNDATRIDKFRSNIVASPVTSPNLERAAVIYDGPVDTTQNSNTLDPAECTHNVVVNGIAYTDPSTSNSYAGFYARFTSSPLAGGNSNTVLSGAGNVLGFVDPDRNAAKWAVSRYDAASGATLRAKLDAARAVLKLNPRLGFATGVGLFHYVWAGFATPHASVVGTAHDGTNRGAVQ